jgi:hypothetical protein
MKVKELIAILAEVNPESDVRMVDDMPVTGVDVFIDPGVVYLCDSGELPAVGKDVVEWIKAHNKANLG